MLGIVGKRRTRISKEDLRHFDRKRETMDDGLEYGIGHKSSYRQVTEWTVHHYVFPQHDHFTRNSQYTLNDGQSCRGGGGTI